MIAALNTTLRMGEQGARNPYPQAREQKKDRFESFAAVLQDLFS